MESDPDLNADPVVLLNRRTPLTMLLAQDERFHLVYADSWRWSSLAMPQTSAEITLDRRKSRNRPTKFLPADRQMTLVISHARQFSSHIHRTIKWA